ncbi:uncharacterized protein LOC144749534 [Ciona intestinalis]
MLLLILLLQLQYSNLIAIKYNDLGCWTDSNNPIFLGPRSIPTLEGTDPTLSDSYSSRTNALQKCARVALARHYEVFAVQDGGWCAGSADAKSTYKKYGRSTVCAADGKGGPLANQVYEILGNFNCAPKSNLPKNT